MKDRRAHTDTQIDHSTPELDGPIRKASLAFCLQRLLLSFYRIDLIYSQMYWMLMFGIR